MPDIGDVNSSLAEENGLAVISTTQADGRVLSSIANCGVIDHPVSGLQAWRWSRQVARPDDLPEGIDGEALRLILRHVFQAAGGTHDDFDEYDRTMADEGRAAIFVAPSRILGNG